MEENNIAAFYKLSPPLLAMHPEPMNSEEIRKSYKDSLEIGSGLNIDVLKGNYYYIDLCSLPRKKKKFFKKRYSL